MIVSDEEAAYFKVGSCAMQGWKNSMEDSHICMINFMEDVGLFAVFDGHGGKDVALYAKKYLPLLLKSSSSFVTKDYKAALNEAFIGIDYKLKTEEGRKELEKIHKENNESEMSLTETGKELADKMGCTACVALITKKDIFVANAGDSRCVLCKDNNAVSLSIDHKPDIPTEKVRIEKAGGIVEGNRINKIINLSRALGDLAFKANTKLMLEDQIIIPIPDVQVIPITPDCQFLLLACDGIWDSYSSQKAIDFILDQQAKEQFMRHKPLQLSKALGLLFNKIICSNPKVSGGIGADNMTAIIIQFIQPKSSTH